MSKIDEIRKRIDEISSTHASEAPAMDHMPSATRTAGRHRGELLAFICGLLNGEWQSERPGTGLWWLGLHPDHRSKVEDWPEVVPVYVDFAGGCLSAGVYVAGCDYILTGALWQRRTVPGDPFAKGGGE